MAELKIRLLGQFTVSMDNTPITSFASDKVRALFAYLVTEAQCPHRREILANLLWSDQPEETCRANLRRALSDLRKCIQDHDANPPYLLISRQDIQFNLESNTWVDIAILDELYRQTIISPENHKVFYQILDLYQGDFLEGISIADSLHFNEWVMMMREKQNRKVISILSRIASYSEEQQEYKDGLPFAWRLVEMEPWQEDARRQLMRLLVQTGRRHEAINQYKILAKQLKKELGIEPEAQTATLYNLIKEGKPFVEKQPIKSKPPAIMQDASAMHSLSQEVFVGRDKELGELNQMLEEVLAGQGRLGFVSGEAGSGKSMLVREFIRQAQSRHSALVAAVGFCNPFSGIGDPYLPFREILFQLCGNVEHTRSTGEFSRSYLLRLWNIKPNAIKALTLYGDDLLNTLISSQALLNVAASVEDTYPDILVGVTDLVERKSIQPGGTPPQPNIFSQYCAVLKAVAREYPLLLVLDDLQWADAGTIGLLFHLGKQLAGSSIKLLGAFRSEEVAIRQDGACHPLMSVLSELKRDYGEITISLDRPGDKAFVDDLLASEPNDLDENFHESLLRHTDGHPLFTVELLRGLQENGTLVRDSLGRWVVKQDFQIDKLPPKIEGIIGERINRLPNILQQVLAAASVEGETFTAEVISEVEGLPMPQIINLFSGYLDKQHRLVRAQQIDVDEDKTISTYKFRHILFQKYLYDQLDKIERTNYHARVGAALERLVGEDKEPYAVYLARHFHEANQVEKAVFYYQMAGGVAVRMSAHLEAISHFERALKLLLSLPASSQRDQQELGLQLQVGLAYQAIQGYAAEPVGKAFERAWDLGKKIENAVLVKQAYQLTFSYYSNIAEFEIAKEINDLDKQNLDRCTPQGNLEYHWGEGYIDLCLGRLGSAYKNFTQMLRYYDLVEARSYVESVGMEAGVLGNGHAAVLAANVGYPNRAKEHIRNILNIAEKWRDSGIVQTDAMWYPAWAYYELGEYSQSREYLDKAIALAEKYHIVWVQAFLKLIDGRLLSRNEKHEEAIRMVKEGMDLLNMIGFITFRPLFYLGLVEAYCAAERIDQGLLVVREAEAFSDDTGGHRFSSPIQKVKGDLMLKKKDEAGAEEAYMNAISIARQQEAKMLELQAALSLCHLWKKQGEQQQSAKLLQPIYDWFSEGFDSPWLIEAGDLLESFSSEN